MTTSSFERNRCTRISPSAVLDDRLDGKDLEWARDHLRRCETCRERVEDFREMLLRVGRLPSATVGSTAMDQAFALSIPDRMRNQTARRSFELAPAPSVAAPSDLPQPVRPEVSSLPDLMTELEREIFRDEPSIDHPTPAQDRYCARLSCGERGRSPGSHSRNRDEVPPCRSWNRLRCR